MIAERESMEASTRDLWDDRCSWFDSEFDSSEMTGDGKALVVLQKPFSGMSVTSNGSRA